MTEKPTAFSAPRLCWNAIVKDETAVLDRLLRSLSPWIDCWVVCDTGSTDGTPERLAGFFEREGIPGERHRIPFGDFGRARNEALDLARASALSFDWLLLCDADMELVVEGTVAPFDGIRFLDHADGGCRPEKSERDIALLSAALAEDPADSRSLFYLA